MLKAKFLTLMLLSFLVSAAALQFAFSAGDQYAGLSSEETTIISRINGTRAYDYDLELEKITLNHSLSGFSFRSSGSSGANETAIWIVDQFSSFGLETSLEPFEFMTWNLPSEPVLVIDEDGNESTTSDQVKIGSFCPEQYSLPTPEGGVFADLVVLPLPEVNSRMNLLVNPRETYNATAWNAVDTTGKILLIGREIRWNERIDRVYRNKLAAQPPAVVLYTWWYDWMAWAPPSFSSGGGRPLSDQGSFYWDLGIPVGWISYEDGLMIRNREANNTSLSASVKIEAEIGVGPNYNVVGKLPGSEDPERLIIVSAHYDSVTSAGFCDNGAGVAGLLELAHVFSEAAQEGLYKPKPTVLFVAFTGEELGYVGALNFMKQHEDELGKISAVINLDCLGASSTLEISETFPDDSGLDLQDIVLKAAEDLGVGVNLAASGGSDQEAFRNLAWADHLYHVFWQSTTGIDSTTRVKSSIMISSYPLFISEMWNGGVPGWIHTPYDNSTSTEAFGWVTTDNLESHVRVAGLSVMRTISAVFSPFLLHVYSVTAVIGVAAVVVGYFERSRIRVFSSRIVDNVLFYIEEKELVSIILLTAIFLLISVIVYTRIGDIEVVSQGYPVSVMVQYIGAPFEMVAVPSNMDTTVTSQFVAPYIDSMPEYIQANTPTIVLWQGLLLNVVLYLSISFILVYTVTRIAYSLSHAKVLVSDAARTS
jgi:hypothetical protein